MPNDSALTPLTTRWGEEIDTACPWGEYPRPQLRRSGWQCLNGTWEYAITDGAATGESGADSVTEPEAYDGAILVPFSPESLLSGVGRQLQPGQTLWYRREVRLGAVPAGMRLLLHFGAVDQRCAVFVNGVRAGSHDGGYWPFSLDITTLVGDGTAVLTVAVWDDSDQGLQAYGKQKLARGGIWYTAQSGIWQTVWTETVPAQHIESLAITPRCDTGEVAIRVRFSQPDPPPCRVSVRDGDTVVAEGDFEGGEFVLPLPGFRYWSPEDPFLYSLTVKAGDDEVESYFGMREFGIVTDAKGLPRLGLNGKPIFHSGLLDQGYWSDGLYTAPSDEAMVSEISALKELGFTMLRKHIKIEPLRWYYHCDRLGMLVWQDFVSGGGPYGSFVTRYLPFVGWHVRDTGVGRGFGRASQAGRDIFRRDMARTVDLLRNVVSLAVWVPFNEGWGQFDAARVADDLRALDDTRLVDHASGWHDQRAGDFASHHVYFKKFRMRRDRRGRVQALTEFGGYSCPSAGHMASGHLYGYRMYHDAATLTRAFVDLYEREVIPAVARGLSAAVYTQVSDVEDEINGLFTYDRAELKLEAAAVKAVNQRLKESAPD